MKVLESEYPCSCFHQFLESEQINAPKFFIGQRVVCHWVSDEGIHYTDEGVIAGLFYRPRSNSYKAGWEYWVRWEKLSVDFLDLPHYEEALEADLTAITKIEQTLASELQCTPYP